MDGDRIEAAARRIEAALARLATVAERPPPAPAPAPAEAGVPRGEVSAALADLDALIAELEA